MRRSQFKGDGAPCWLTRALSFLEFSWALFVCFPLPLVVVLKQGLTKSRLVPTSLGGEDELKLLILLSLAPLCWDYMHGPSYLLHAVLGIELRVFCVLYKHQAISPALNLSVSFSFPFFPLPSPFYLCRSSEITCIYVCGWVSMPRHGCGGQTTNCLVASGFFTVWIPED